MCFVVKSVLHQEKHQEAQGRRRRRRQNRFSQEEEQKLSSPSSKQLFAFVGEKDDTIVKNFSKCIILHHCGGNKWKARRNCASHLSFLVPFTRTFLLVVEKRQRGRKEATIISSHNYIQLHTIAFV
jgi:hypothetical protein